MQDINIQIDPRTFNERYFPYLDAQEPMQIFFGGSSSGKSFFILGQRIVLDILRGERNYLIIRNVGRTHRISTFNEITKGIERLGSRISGLFSINKSDMSITCSNGYQILFQGLDDVQKLKSITPKKGVITDVVIEEATETQRDDIKELRRRLRGKSNVTKRTVFLFNPIYKTHWIYRDNFSGRFDETKGVYRKDGLLIVKSTYKDNLRFLGEEDVEVLESETDEYYYNVYTLGNWGMLGDVIFKNWTVADLSGIKDEFDKFRNGLDFGFTNDPTTLSRSTLRDNTIYITDEIYKRGLMNEDIAEEIKPIISNEPVTCDSAEPKSIAELRSFNINAIPSKKGKDSVNHGIQWLQRKKIIVDKKCQGAINELTLYHWKKDKDGNAINQPVDKFNHFIDATRYAYEDEMTGEKVMMLTDDDFREEMKRREEENKQAA